MSSSQVVDWSSEDYTHISTIGGNGRDATGGLEPTLVILEPCWEMEKRKANSSGWSAGQWAKDLDSGNKPISSIILVSVVLPWIVPEPRVDVTLLNRKNKEGGRWIQSGTIESDISNKY